MPEPIIQPPAPPISVTADSDAPQQQPALGSLLQSFAQEAQSKQPVKESDDLDSTPDPSPAPAPKAPKAKSQAAEPKEKPQAFIAPPPVDDEPEPTIQDKYALAPELDKITLKGKEQGHWQKLKEDRNNLAQQLRTIQAEAESLRSKQGSVDPEQIQRLTKERDEAFAQLEAVAIEHSPRFKQQFQPRIDSALALAKAAVGSENADVVTALLMQPDSESRTNKLEDIISNLGQIKAGKLASAISEIDKIEFEKSKLLSNSKQTLNEWNAQTQKQRQEAEKQRQEKIASSFEKIHGAWKKSGIFKDAGDEVVQQAKDIFHGSENLTMEDMANASHWAAIAPKLAKQNKELLTKVNELEQKLKAIHSASPDGSFAGEDAPSGDEIPESGGFIAAVKNAAWKMGLK